MNKKEYVMPEMKIIVLEIDDVITASNGSGNGSGGGFEGEWDIF